MRSLRVIVASALAIVVLALHAPARSARTKDSTKATKAAPTAKDAKAQKAAPAVALLDINKASKAELSTLPGIGEAYSQKIIDGRPFARKDQLVSRNIIPQATYDKIKDQIIATQSGTKKS